MGFEMIECIRREWRKKKWEKSDKRIILLLGIVYEITPDFETNCCCRFHIEFLSLSLVRYFSFLLAKTLRFFHVPIHVNTVIFPFFCAFIACTILFFCFLLLFDSSSERFFLFVYELRWVEWRDFLFYSQFFVVVQEWSIWRKHVTPNIY